MAGHASYNQISDFCILCRDFYILCRDPHVGLSFVIKYNHRQRDTYIEPETTTPEYKHEDVTRTLVVQINVAGYSLEA